MTAVDGTYSEVQFEESICESAIHTQSRGLLSSPSDLCGIKLRLRYEPAVAVVGTNSEIKVGGPMSDYLIPT